MSHEPRINNSRLKVLQAFTDDELRAEFVRRSKAYRTLPEGVDPNDCNHSALWIVSDTEARCDICKQRLVRRWQLR